MYPGIFRRGVAALIDIIVVVYCIIFALRFPIISGAPWAKLAVAVAVPLLYEPLFSAYACTIGQALTRTRIRDSETMKRMSLRQTYVRFLIKYVATILGSMGAVSSAGAVRAVSIVPRGDGRAAHDLQAGTVVIGVDAT